MSDHEWTTDPASYTFEPPFEPSAARSRSSWLRWTAAAGLVAAGLGIGGATTALVAGAEPSPLQGTQPGTSSSATVGTTLPAVAEDEVEAAD
jgi:hypothetical protein